LNYRLVILLLILINTSFVYSQSNDKRYKKTRKVQVGAERKAERQKNKLARIDKREKRRKIRLGKKNHRKFKRGNIKQDKYSMDKQLSKRQKKTKTAYDELLKDDASFEDSLLWSREYQRGNIKISEPLTNDQVAYRSAKQAKFKKKVAKKVKRKSKKFIKNYNYGREKGQQQQDRVYKKMRKAGRKTKRVHKGKHPDPWIKRIFRKKRGRTATKKKE